MPKLLNRRKTRPLLEQLENRLCMATGAYTYSVVAATGNTVNAPGGGPVGTLTNISLASINTSGNVAFVGTVNGFNSVDEATLSTGSWSLTDLVGSSSLNYTYPQIDDNGEVIAANHQLVGSSVLTFIRLWYPNGSNATIASGSSSSPGGDILGVPTVSPNEQWFAYEDQQLQADGTYDTFLDISNGASVQGLPTNSHSGGLQPMIANNGAVVIRDGSTAIDPILLIQIGKTPVTIADPAYFSSIGNNPGISPDGNVVAFTATITNAASAASLTAVNAASLAAAQALDPNFSLHVNPLTPGPGVFASIPVDNPSSGPADRVVIRLAGVSGSGYLNPGETWTGGTHGTDVGPFSAFPDARSVPESILGFSTKRALTGGAISVAFMANDTTSSANEGLYNSFISIGAGSAAVDNPIEVVNGGETITVNSGGETTTEEITAVNDYFPMNANGQVVFVANTAGGQAVVQANPYTYLPPSVTNPLLYNAYKPSQIRTAYGIDQIPMFTGPNGQQVTPDGTGQTIAIVDPYDDPNIINDLTQFDSAMGLPAPPSFQVYDQTGFNITSLIGISYPGVPPVDPDPTGGWEKEESLDVEWAHAIAPGASIILVEANSNSPADLENAAVAWAASPASGASVVSLSFGVPEFSGEGTFDESVFKKIVGVTIVAGAGDQGAPGIYPAVSPNVVAVGGTTLYLNPDNSYGSETAWGLGGGGVSLFESQPAYQNGVATPFSASKRVTPDVSFDADPRTGPLIYDSFRTSSPWRVFSGTSLGAPSWAGLIAIANQGRVLLGKAPLSGATETLPALYSLPAVDFHDVTTGNNGQYQLDDTNQFLFSAGPGYDAATGRGSPVANRLVPDLVAYASAPTITVNTSSLALGTTTGGTAGVSQSFTVSGSNLKADIILAAPPGVELSDNGGTSYSSTLDLVESGGTLGTTTVLARITAAAPAGPLSGNIAADSTGATERDITVTGTVNPASVPAITVSTSSLSLGTTTQGTAGASQSFTVSGGNLKADIILTAPSGVELSDDGGTSYSSTLDLVESGGTVGTTTVLARIAAGAPVGPVSGKIAADSTGATEQDITVTGTVSPFTVTAIAAVSPNPRNAPVTIIDITFSGQIKPQTLIAGLTLTDNGGPNLINGAVTVSLVSGSTYQIGGLGGLTTVEGNYTLTVNAAAVQNAFGKAGAGSMSTSWLMDTTPPSSHVNALPARETSLSFVVSVTGTDPSGASGSPPSGVASYDIYASTNGGGWSLWTTVTASSPSATFTGQSKTTYAFYSIAHDRAGNTEVKTPQIEASTYLPNLTPPVTSVNGTTGTNSSTVNTSTGTFTLNLTGSDPGGSILNDFEVFVSIDGGAYQQLGPYVIPAGAADSKGNYDSSIIYQGLTDGQSHSYSFYSIGLDAAGNLQSTPSSPNVTFASEVFAVPGQLQVTGFTVEHGSPSRSFVRYLDLGFNESDSQSGGGLSSIISSLSTSSPDILIYKYNLNGDASSKTAVSLSGISASVIDHAIELNFGSGGIGGSPNTTAADGYYEVDIKPSGVQTSVHHFYRLLGDVNGDGIVDQNDVNQIAASINDTSQAGWTPLSADVTGSGTVTAFDLTLATRSKGRKLGSGLPLG
ncbi:MAG: dockerin type I domain-containing protein [Isosphaeraceae bacterium]